MSLCPGETIATHFGIGDRHEWNWPSGQKSQVTTKYNIVTSLPKIKPNGIACVIEYSQLINFATSSGFPMERTSERKA